MELGGCLSLEPGLICSLPRGCPGQAPVESSPGVLARFLTCFVFPGAFLLPTLGFKDCRTLGCLDICGGWGAE